MASLEQLKKEVIEILKRKEKQENKDIQKAIESFEKEERNHSYLEKSITGEWIEKAGYAVGQMRIWRGKKYKKVRTSPSRWVRVYDSHSRGAAISIGKYIAQVNKCKTVEELYQFCMKEKALFKDDNGVDLPILDKLKKEIDKKNESLSSKTTSFKEPETTKTDFSKMSYDEILSHADELLTESQKKDLKEKFSQAETFSDFMENLTKREYAYGFAPADEFSEKIGKRKPVLSDVAEAYILGLNSKGQGLTLSEKVKKFDELKKEETKPTVNQEALKTEISDYYKEQLSYSKWIAERSVKKLGEKKLKEIADKNMKSDEDWKNELLEKVSEMIKENPQDEEKIKDSMKTAIYFHAVRVLEVDLARKKLDSMSKNIEMKDVPVKDSDMTEAKSIIGGDVARILDGRDVYGNAKQTLQDKIKRRFKTNPAVCRAMLVYIKQEQEKTGKQVFTARNGIWELLPKLNEKAQEAAEKGESETPTGTSGNLYENDNGVSIVENKDWGRYQISFPGKPDGSTISMLKRNGFRWSPSTKTWVCYNGENGERKMKYVAEQLGLNEVKKSFDFSKYLKKSMSFEELKKWAINHLKKQLQDEDVAKSLYLTTLEVIQKAAYPVGTIREWKGKKYIKTAPGKWMRKYDNAGGRGYNRAIKNLMRKVEATETPEQLYSLIKQNLRRFKDEKTGKILPEVKEIYAMAKNEKSSTGKLTETINSIGKKKGEVKKEETSDSLREKYKEKNKEYSEIIQKLIYARDHDQDTSKYDEKATKIQKELSDIENKIKNAEDREVKRSGKPSGFTLDDINSQKTVKTIEDFEDVIKEIDKIKDDYEAADKYMDFLASNIEGGFGGKLRRAIKRKYKSENLRDLAREVKGKKPLDTRDVSFADEYANEQEDREYIKQEKANQTKEHNLKTPKKNIGEVINKGNETVEIPSNKQARLEIDQLKKTASKEEIRENLKHVYYEDGKLIATNGRILKTVQVGELGDIPDGSYVEIDTKGKNIVIKKMNGDGMRFPNWKTVMPESNTKKASINGKVLQEKIKEMEKNGSFPDKRTKRWGEGNIPILRFEVKNGEITLDGTIVGKTNELADTNIQMNKDMLKNVITDNDFTLMMSDKDTETRGMSISNETSDNVIMPLSNEDRFETDYANNRDKYKFNKQKKENASKGVKKSFSEEIQDILKSLKK